MPVLEEQTAHPTLMPEIETLPCAPAPIWHRALGWVILVPMLYIAANGTFIPRSGGVDFSATGQAPGTPASHKVSLALVCLLCILLVAFRRSAALALSRRVKLLLAFPALGILSCVWSADPLQSIVSGTVLLVFTILAIYVASQFLFQAQFELLMFVGAIALPLSIALALFFPSMGASEAGWRGIFGHKQVCAAISLFWLITALHWKCFGVHQKIFRATSVAMCVLLIVMSQSRTGWALALVALSLTAAIWLLQRTPGKQTVAMTIIALPVVAALLYGVQSYFPFLLSSVGKDSTLSERTIIWSAVWDAAMKHPILGYGFTAFWRGLYGPSQGVVLTAGWGLQQAQDGFLDVWLGIGAVGVGLVALTVFQAVRNSIRAFYSEPHKAYIRWCIVVIVCTLLYNIGESSIGLINMNWFLFLLACIGLKQALMTRDLLFPSPSIVPSSTD